MDKSLDMLTHCLNSGHSQCSGTFSGTGILTRSNWKHVCRAGAMKGSQEEDPENLPPVNLFNKRSGNSL